MQSRKQTQSLLLIVVGLTCVAFAALYFIRQTLLSEPDTVLQSNDNVSVVTPLPNLSELVEDTNITSFENSPFVYPAQLNIRQVGINVPVVVVGLNERGFVTTPQDAAGFWEISADLKQSGNTVIVGHNKSEPVIVFRDIGAVEPSMEIIVTAHTGQELIYTISEIEIIQVAGAPLEQIERVAELMKLQTTAPRLTLVACHPAESCDQRIIVIAEPDG